MAMSGFGATSVAKGWRERRRGADVAPDLVHRVFHAERPHALRVSDQTDVDTTEGMAEVSLVDATRCMIVGWQVASEMTVQTVLSALEVTCLRRGACHAGLSFSLDRAHFDAGSQYWSVREATRLAEIGGVSSVGQPRQRWHRTPESLNAFSEAELVVGPGRGALRDVSHREAVTVSSFTWWRNPDSRLSRRPEPTTSSGPTRQKTTPPARKDSKVRGLEGSQGEPGAAWRRAGCRRGDLNPHALAGTSPSS